MSVAGTFIWLSFGSMIMMHIVIGQDENSQEEKIKCYRHGFNAATKIVMYCDKKCVTVKCTDGRVLVTCGECVKELPGCECSVCDQDFCNDDDVPLVEKTTTEDVTVTATTDVALVQDLKCYHRNTSEMTKTAEMICFEKCITLICDDGRVEGSCGNCSVNIPGCQCVDCEQHLCNVLPPAIPPNTTSVPLNVSSAGANNSIGN